MKRAGSHLIDIDIPLPQYIAHKISMLQSNFKLKLTEAEIAHMESLQTEIAVDNYAHSLIMKKL